MASNVKMEIVNLLKQRQKSPLEFVYDNLMIPPMWNYLTPWDINELHRIATSVSLASKMLKKLSMIDGIMRARGFRKFAGGTNRVVYRYLEDTRFVVKIAIDQVGMQDNGLEFKNQEYLKPYCAKMFYISPCGTVGFAERVIPVTSTAEFLEVASDVFDVLVYKILGQYVVEDVGTLSYKNWGRMYAPLHSDVYDKTFLTAGNSYGTISSQASIRRGRFNDYRKIG